MSDCLNLAEFEQYLLDLQEQALGVADIVQQSANVVELDQNRVGRLSRMDAMQGQAMAVASADRQADQLELIRQALQRIDEGTFGYCLECDDMIAKLRLQADPTAQYCIECAQKKEQS